MGRTSAAGGAAVKRTLHQELNLVRDAITFVATGGSPRVVVAGIRFGEAILEPASRLALESGVRVRPLRSTEGHGPDLAVEPIQLD